MKLKRITSILLCAAFALALLPSGALAAFDPAGVSTKYICLMDADTGAVLYEKSAREQAYPASTTKIMTCILALEMCDDLNEVVDVGADFDTRGSLMGFVRGEELRMIDLIYGMMLKSGNDAASAIAIHIAGSQDQFAALMNTKAEQLGMTDTHFVKSNGLHKENHYSTAYDMALLSRYAMQNEKFRTIVGSGTYNVPASKWDSDGYALENSNKLLHTKADATESFEYKYATGVKTGDTDQAGRCLVASATKEGVQLILVLLGDYSNVVDGDYRYKNSALFFDWAFEQYVKTEASALGLETSFSQPVSNAAFDDVEAGALTLNVDLSGKSIAGLQDTVSEITSNPSAITCEYDFGAGLSAPITAGEVVGTANYSYQGTPLFSADITASRDVAEIGNVVNTDPASSPLITSSQEPSGNPWLIWMLIAALTLVVYIILRILIIRRNRMRRRRAYRVRRTRR